MAMKQVIPPVAEARDDFAIFKDLSARLGLVPGNGLHASHERAQVQFRRA